MKIGNIVSTTKVSVSDDFNVVQSLAEIIQGLPTMIIGWDYVKKHYPDYNMIERKLGEGLYWTFKKNENRELHDEDIYRFSIKAYMNLVKDVRYYFLDFISLRLGRIKKFLMLVKNTPDIISFRYNYPKKNIDMVYMLINHSIYGVDLNLLEYMGVNKVKLLDKMRKNTHIFLEENAIFIEYEKGLELLDYQVKYIPFLYLIKNGQNDTASLISVS